MKSLKERQAEREKRRKQADKPVKADTKPEPVKNEARGNGGGTGPQAA